MNLNEVESDGHFAALRKRLLKHALYMIVTQSIVLYQGAHASIYIYILSNIIFINNHRYIHICKYQKDDYFLISVEYTSDVNLSYILLY